MSEEASVDEPASAPGVAEPRADRSVWARVQDHKIAQWGLAYLGAALALAHGAELLGHAFEWPELVNRLLMVALIVGFPVALALAWYHGHRRLSQVGAGELMIISVLILIGAVFFTISLRPGGEHVAAAPTPAETAKSDVRSSPANPRTQETSSAARLPNSIAVLPFQNLSSDPARAYFAAGLHDELLARLDKLKSLAVIGRQSVMQFENTTRPSTEIGRELNVKTVLESSVSYDGSRIAVRTRLVDAITGVQLWSEAYNRDFADVFEVQADIAMNIANALRAEFSSDEQARIERVPTKSSAAYSLYLQAAALSRANAVDRLTGTKLLERAIELDPAFADAYGALASRLSQVLVSTTNGASVTPEGRAEFESTLERYAAKALNLDPEQPSALGALGVLALVHWRWSAAEADFRRASASNRWTNSTVAVLYYVYLLGYTGRHDEAIAIAKKARQLNPADPYVGGLGFAYGMAGDYSAAADVWRAAQRYYLPIQSSWLAFAEIARGNVAEARQQLDVVERALGTERPIVFLPELAYGFARAGQSTDARRVFEEIKAAAANHAPLGAGAWAMAYLAVGDQEQVLSWLEVGAKAAAHHDPDPSFINLLNLKMNVTNDQVLRQPKFVAVLNRIGGD